MFSKMTLSVLISGLSVMADCFSSAAFGCFSLSFFLMSVVMSCFHQCHWHDSQFYEPFSLVLVALVY